MARRDREEVEHAEAVDADGAVEAEARAAADEAREVEAERRRNPRYRTRAWRQQHEAEEELRR